MKKSVFIIISFWLAIICGFTLKQEFIMMTGKEILLKTIPVDPRDLFRGDYVILNYEIAQIPRKYRNYGYNTVVYELFDTDENNIAHFSGITDKEPKDSYLKGKVGRCRTAIPFYRNGRCVDFGIESYFVKEGKGRELERDLRNGALVKVVVDGNGNAKVKGFDKK